MRAVILEALFPQLCRSRWRRRNTFNVNCNRCRTWREWIPSLAHRAEFLPTYSCTLPLSTAHPMHALYALEEELFSLFYSPIFLLIFFFSFLFFLVFSYPRARGRGANASRQSRGTFDVSVILETMREAPTMGLWLFKSHVAVRPDWPGWRDPLAMESPKALPGAKRVLDIPQQPIYFKVVKRLLNFKRIYQIPRL